MKFLVITPHLSTGGSPQYILKYLESVLHKYEAIKLVEFTQFSSEYTIQRNKIIQLIGISNFVSLGPYGEDEPTFLAGRLRLLDIIRDFSPTVIWMAECPEGFEYRLPPDQVMSVIYRMNRPYKIMETTHNNAFDFTKKRYIPDQFMFCSNMHVEKAKHIMVPKVVWEYPIEIKERPDRRKTLESLGLDPDYYHVLNVGLINSNKNQKYIFDLAKKFTGHKIVFHFIGNDCFLKDSGITQEDLKQDNCHLWGERSDVDLFMSCMDLYLFPSHKELNPLTIKEALSWQMQVIANRDEYVSQYKSYSNFHVLQEIEVEKFILNNLFKHGWVLPSGPAEMVVTKSQLQNILDREKQITIIRKLKPVKILINVPNCNLKEYQDQKEEAYSTWISWAQKKGIRVVCSLADHLSDTEYAEFGDNLFCKCTDALDSNFILKRYYFLKWAVETQEFDYLFVTSMDTFVHIDRLIKVVEEYRKNPEIKYAGAAVPYQGWNPYENHQEFITMDHPEYDKIVLDGGVGYLITKEIAEMIVNGYEEAYTELENPSTFFADDILFANIVKKHSVALYHDNRFMSSSPFGDTYVDPLELGVPYIKEFNSFLVAQHGVQEKMQEILEHIQHPGKFLIVCSFYNNTAEHIRQTFDNVINQTYTNWTFIIADDFSTNDCRELLMQEFKRRNHPNIVWYEPKSKRELYLYQNMFKNIRYDYYFDLDSDDIISPKILEMYEYHFRKYPNVFSIYSDFTCINEENKGERISAIKVTQDPINVFHSRTDSPDTVTSSFHSWSMFGHGRCFRKVEDNKFPIVHNGRTATDSFTLFSCLLFGDHLQLPRNLYTWKLRKNSDSGTMSIEEWNHYNDNTNAAIKRYEENGIGKMSTLYDSVWLETNALSYSGFTEEEKEIDLVSFVKPEQRELINQLYYDKHISIHWGKGRPCVVVWNKLLPDERRDILKYIRTNPTIKFCIYFFFEVFEYAEESIHSEIEKEHMAVVEEVGRMIPIRYFRYYRHLVITRV